MRTPRWMIAAGALIVFLLVGWLIIQQTVRVEEVQGTVTAGGKPIRGAVIRVKATEFQTRTDEAGRFVLSGFPPRFSVPVTAWLNGHYISGATAYPWKRTVEIPLQTYRTTDNADYAWIAPQVEGRSGVEEFLVQAGLSVAAKLSFNRVFLPLSARLQLGCRDCHGRTIFDQWAPGAHAQGNNNLRFMTMYNGTDVQGNKSPPTQYGFHQDYGRFPIRPDRDRPYHGPGFKLDFPDQAGNCATCHTPGAALRNPYGTDPNLVSGIDATGSHCDFCHKVADVAIDPVSQLPYENMPGVLSMELRRPAGDPQIFFGPFDDVAVGPDTFSSLQDESRFCAPCHNASFWGTPVYQSYSEWLASSYPKEGKTCQSCHMKPDGITTNFAPGRGGLERDPQKIFMHDFPGAADIALLRDTANLELRASREGNIVSVEVAITNENAGHHIPTDHPMRNIILVVSPTDAQGKALSLLDGPRVPEWGGVGDASNDYAGQAGKGFAKILEELWTEIAPSAAYWRQSRIIADTRIPAKETDVTRYKFRTDQPGMIIVDARLIFRRAFKDLAEAKKWEIPDVEMEHETLILP